MPFKSDVPTAQEKIDSNALISLAMLKVNWDVLKKDYLENFVPFVAESLKSLSSDVVSLAELQGELVRHFSLELSQNNLKTILNRMKKRDLIILRDRVYYRNLDALEGTNFGEARQKVLVAHDLLIADVCRFAKEAHRVEWNSEIAEKALQAYLAETQEQILVSLHMKSQLPQIVYRKDSERFIIASFVEKAKETHSSSLGHFETILKGRMLANAIFLPDITNAERNFKNTEVYFDTSFLIFALGYAGQPRKDPCTELLRLLWESGAELRCFEHTLDEVRGILAACAYNIGTSRAYGPSIEYFVSQGYKASDIELLSTRLQRDLESLRIKVAPSPAFIQRFVIDEKGFSEALSISISYHGDGARDRDVRSIAAVMRLRGTASYFHVEECHAVFVTTNFALVRTAWDFLMANSTPGSIPPAITDYNLSNLLWLKKPMRAPDLPMKRLMADCYAAIQPTDRLWKQYLDEVEKLGGFGKITAEDVVLLRHSLSAKTALMEMTLGDEQAFTEGTVTEILEVVRFSIENKLRTEKEFEVAEKEQAKVALEAEHAAKLEYLRTVRRNSQAIAGYTVAALKTIVLVMLGVSTVWSFPWKLPSFSAERFGYIDSALAAFFLVAGAVHLYWGTTLKTHLRRFEDWLAFQAEKLLLRLSGLEN